MSLIFSTIPGASGSSKTSFSSISRCSKSFFLLQYVYNYVYVVFRTKVLSKVQLVVLSYESTTKVRRYLFYYKMYESTTVLLLYTYTYKRIVHVHKFRDEIVKLHYCSKMDCTVRVQRCTMYTYVYNLHAYQITYMNMINCTKVQRTCTFVVYCTHKQLCVRVLYNYLRTFVQDRVRCYDSLHTVAPSIHANSRRSTVSLFRSVYESTFVRKVRTPYNSSVDYTYTKLVTDTYADTFKVKNAITTTTVVLGVPVEYLRIPSRFVLSK